MNGPWRLCSWVRLGKAYDVDLEVHLRHEPRKRSKSRIKRLRGLRKPQFRLRVSEIRVFYDVVEDQVHVLAIVAKGDASTWLNEFGDEG